MRAFWVTAVVIVLLAALTRPGAAESLPSFDMDYCCQHAATIVGPSTGGELASLQVISGKPIDADSMHFPSDSALRKAMGLKDLERYDVVAFLNQDGDPVLGQAGVVGLLGDDVFAWQDQAFGSKPAKLEGYSRKNFLEAVNRAVDRKRRREELLARGPSAERARGAVAFVIEQGVGKHEPARRNPQLQRAEIARGLAPIDEREQEVILAAIDSADSDEHRAALLQLAGGIPLSETAFDPIAARLDPSHPSLVRKAAAEAASGIDNYRAAERVADLLALEDPDLLPLLRSLQHPRSSGGAWVRNPRTVDALIDLAGDFRVRQRTLSRYAHGNEGYALLHAMEYYFHPRMLPILRDWAVADDHVSSNQALSNLGQLSGLPVERGATEAYDAWWASARDAISRRYDLSRREDLSAWLAAFHGGDETTRRMLLRLWQFEQQPDVDEMLERAAAAGDMTSLGAKAALAELWQNKRLAAKVKRAIVERFVEVELVELPDSPEANGYRRLKILAHKRFPFPHDAWVEPNYEAAVDRELPPLDDSWGAFSLEGSGELALGSWSGGSFPGTPVARALMVLREVDYYALGKKREVWRVEWRLGPKKLRPTP